MPMRISGRTFCPRISHRIGTAVDGRIVIFPRGLLYGTQQSRHLRSAGRSRMRPI